MEATFTRRIIRQILPNRENDFEVSEDQEITIQFSVSQYKLNQLLNFVESTDAENSRRVQEIIMSSISFVGVNKNSALSLYLDHFFPDRSYLLSILVLLTLILLCIALILRMLISTMSKLHCLIIALSACICLDFVFSFYRLYYEEMAHTVTLMERNVDACTKDQSAWNKFANWVTRTDGCLEFNKAALVGIVWKVSPNKILAESMTSWFVVLAGNLGASFQAACNQISFWLLPAFFVFCLILAALYWGISIRAPLGFGIQFGGNHVGRDQNYVRDRDTPGGIEDLPPRNSTTTQSRNSVTVAVQTINIISVTEDEIPEQNAANVSAATSDEIVRGQLASSSCENQLFQGCGSEPGAGDIVVRGFSQTSEMIDQISTETQTNGGASSVATQTDLNYFLDEDTNIEQTQRIVWNIRPLSPDI